MAMLAFWVAGGVHVHFHPVCVRVPGERAFVSAGYSAAGDEKVLASRRFRIRCIFQRAFTWAKSPGTRSAGPDDSAAWVAVSYVIARLAWHPGESGNTQPWEMSEMKKTNTMTTRRDRPDPRCRRAGFCAALFWNLLGAGEKLRWRGR